MAFTTNDLDKVRTAIASGALEVEYEGPPRRRIRYRSMNELLQAEARIVRALDTGHRSKNWHVLPNKGLNC